MHAAVVEFDALPDSVRPRAEDEHLGSLGLRGDLGLGGGVELVAAVVVGRLGLELGGAGVDGLEHRVDAEPLAQRTHADLTGQLRSQCGDLAVGQTVVLAAPQQLFVEHRRVEQLGPQRHQPVDLLDEPGVDAGCLGDGLDARPEPQRQLDVVEPSVGRGLEPVQQLVDTHVGVRRRPEAGPPGLQRPHHLAQCLDEVAAQRHRLADRLHRGRQRGIGAGELLEREPRRLDDDVVESRLEAGRGFLGDVVEDLVEGVADRELGGDLGDREASRLGRQRRGARHPRVHLDHDEPAVGGVDRELDVAAAGVDADLAQDGDAEIAHALVLAVGQRHRRRDGDRIAGVHTHRVEVLDRAHHHHVVAAVAHQLELEFLPAVDGFLDQHVGRGRRGKAVAGHPVDVLGGVGHARAEPAHRERRPHHDRQPEFGDGLANLVHGETHTGAGGFAADLGDDVLELLPVLAALDRFEVGADQLDAVALEDAVLVQRDGGVQRGLAAQRGQQGVDLVAALRLLRDDPLDEGRRDRLDVGVVGELRVGHDRRRVGVHEADLQPLGPQHPARLGARVVELAGLADDDRPRADHQDVVQVSAARHLANSPRHQVDELVEQVFRVVRTGRGLGVVLHRERTPVNESDAFDDAVVGAGVAHFGGAERGVEPLPRLAFQREAVVLRGDRPPGRWRDR